MNFLPVLLNIPFQWNPHDLWGNSIREKAR